MLNQNNIITVAVLFISSVSFAANNSIYLNEKKPSAASNTSYNTKANPLSSYSALWNTAKFKNLNTAKDVSYLSQNEKEIIWILNQVRHSPQLFLSSVLLNPKSKYYVPVNRRNYYYSSLIGELKNAKSISTALVANEKAFESALCHAVESGKAGYVGHDRINNCKSYFMGECCQYGYDDPMAIVLALLIDNNVPSLGHRKICLSPDYTSMGVSIQPHTTYRFNAVLDFYY